MLRTFRGSVPRALPQGAVPPRAASVARRPARRGRAAGRAGGLALAPHGRRTDGDSANVNP